MVLGNVKMVAGTNLLNMDTIRPKFTKLLHLYVLDILYDEKEIIITRSKKLLWNLIPISPEAFKLLQENFPEYSIIEIDESVMVNMSDRNKLMNPN